MYSKSIVHMELSGIQVPVIFGFPSIYIESLYVFLTLCNGVITIVHIGLECILEGVGVLHEV